MLIKKQWKLISKIFNQRAKTTAGRIIADSSAWNLQHGSNSSKRRYYIANDVRTTILILRSYFSVLASGGLLLSVDIVAVGKNCTPTKLWTVSFESRRKLCGNLRSQRQADKGGEGRGEIVLIIIQIFNFQCFRHERSIRNFHWINEICAWYNNLSLYIKHC